MTITCDSILSACADDSDRGPLFFDLETIPSERVELPKDETPQVEAKPFSGDDAELTAVLSKNMPEIKAFIANHALTADQLGGLAASEAFNKSRAGVLKAVDEAIAKLSAGDSSELSPEDCKLMSLTPEYCRIAAFGWAIGDGPVRGVVLDEEDEKGVLAAFWQLAKRFGPVVGFNSNGFDLPVIMVRSALLGIAPTAQLDLRPWSTNCIDIYAKRFAGGKPSGKTPGKLKELAPLYGIEVPADDVDGSQVFELYKSNPAKLEEYVCSDVQVMRDLYGCWKGFFC